MIPSILPSRSLRMTARHFPAIVLGAYVCLALPAMAATLNLTDITVNGIPTSMYAGNDGQNHVGGFINGALFQRAVPGSGAGQFRQLFRVSDSNDADVIERGYNRGGIMDSETPNGFNPLIRVQNLVESSEGGFYMFALDANESSGGNNSYLSLDMFSIYVGGVNDPAPLPAAEANLGQLGTRVYTFATNDGVLLDATTSSGSGTADMLVFVPKSLFNGFAPDSYVYTFVSHGGSSAPGFGASGGNEEWAAIQTPMASYIPEPGAWAIALVGGILGLTTRYRRRR